MLIFFKNCEAKKVSKILAVMCFKLLQSYIKEISKFETNRKTFLKQNFHPNFVTFFAIIQLLTCRIHTCYINYAHYGEQLLKRMNETFYKYFYCKKSTCYRTLLYRNTITSLKSSRIYFRIISSIIFVFERTEITFINLPTQPGF